MPASPSILKATTRPNDTVLDGQQRLTSLFIAIAGTYDGKKLFVDVLSGGGVCAGRTWRRGRFRARSCANGDGFRVPQRLPLSTANK
jgi:hypothetical protein